MIDDVEVPIRSEGHAVERGNRKERRGRLDDKEDEGDAEEAEVD